MADDFYSYSARQQLAQLDAERAEALADLARYKAANDPVMAATEIQRLADINAKQRNLVELHQQYEASQRPPQPQELTQEERLARPLEKMSAEDALELAKTSRYGKDLSFSD